MAILLIASVIGMYVMGLSVIQANRVVVTRQATLDAIQMTLSTFKDAETGQRGYLLVGEESYLKPYNEALSLLKSQVDKLRSLATEGQLDKQDIAEIERLAGIKLEELRSTIERRRAAGFEEAVKIVREDSGRQTMDALRAVFARVIQTQTAELDLAHQIADRATVFRTALFATVAAINLIFLVWAYSRTRKEMLRAALATFELREQKDLLAVTLSSIGDGVIVTDLQGRITFMNGMAETLTGWSMKQATGAACRDVFRIINETSRQVVESPVEKVLRLGAIVGLANHTLLIRKDGTEIPIDDSGAPIRDVHDALRGVVLVFRDFSDHKAAERQLLAAKEEAEAANVAKDNFLATLSHELRTPLTPVLASLSIWSESRDLPEDLRDDLQMVRRNIELEARLIDDLLDLTRIVRGKLSLHIETVDLHGLINSVTEMYRSEIQGKKLRLSMNLEAQKYQVRSDIGRMQQVLWNILKNAAKFTPEQGEIRIYTENDGDGRARIRISDTGIGMTRETLEKLFEPFEQGAEDIVKRYGGLGLGLAISKALIEAQGGTIAAESEGPNRGATFILTLPIADGLLAEAASNSLQSAAKNDIGSQRPLRILLVEDHVDTARVMTRLLSGLGHTVQAESSVANAFKAIQQSAFDVLISDIGLPDGTGMDLIRQVRQTLNLKLPAIALTGYGMEEDIVRCREAGFSQHLTKPVNFHNLDSLVRRLTAESVN